MTRPRGLSLLEVVLALAILGVALALIGELIRIGTRAGEAARDDLESQLLCESIINEIAAGTQLPEPVFDQPIDDLGEWLYSVETEPVDAQSLIAIRVSVRRADKMVSSTRPEPLPYTLTRWMIDPEVELASRDAEAIMKEQLALRAAAQASGTETDSSSVQGDSQGGGGANPGAAAPPPTTTPDGAPPGFGPDQGGRGGRGGRGNRGDNDNGGGRRGGNDGSRGGRGGNGAGGPGGGLGNGGSGGGRGGRGGGGGGRPGGGFGGGGRAGGT